MFFSIDGIRIDLLGVDRPKMTLDIDRAFVNKLKDIEGIELINLILQTREGAIVQYDSFLVQTLISLHAGYERDASNEKLPEHRRKYCETAALVIRELRNVMGDNYR